MSTIPLRPARGRTVPGARRAFHYAEAPAFHPAGDATSPTVPGTFALTLAVDYRNPPTLAPAAFGAMLQSVLADRTLFPQGGVALVGSPTVATTGRPTDSLVAVATVRVSGALPQNALRTAMVRAVFWSVTLTAPNGQPIARDGADGGSSITRALAGNPSGQVVRASFDARLLAAATAPAPAIVALPTTPPPGPIAPPTAPISLPALGVRSNALTRPQIARFQQILTAAGFDTRGADGAIGANTRAAVTAFQRAWQVGNRALGERTIAFLAATESLGVDGDLGPKTQRALAWLATPIAQGGGGLTVDAAPALPGTTTRPPVTSSPATGSSTSGGAATRPLVTSSPATGGAATQASMGGGTIAVFALGAAAVGVAIAYRDKLFGGARRGGAAIARRYKAARRGSGG